jgi:hypothetical protein
MLELIVVVLAIIFFVFYITYKKLESKVKILFGYKLYEYTKILSYGMKDISEWHRTDEDALKQHSDFEFVSVIKPYKKKLKPVD